MNTINRNLALCLMVFKSNNNGIYVDDDNKIVICNRSESPNRPAISQNTLDRYLDQNYTFYDSKGVKINIQ